MTTPRRVVAALALVTVVVVTVAPTGGVSSISAQRAVDVAVVDDESAYLSVTTHDPEVGQSGEVVSLLELTNQLPQKVEVSVDGNRSDHLPVTPSSSFELGPGDSKTVKTEADTCDDDTTDPVFVDLDVSGTGSSVEVDLTRTVRVDFDCVTQTTTETTTETTSS